MDLEKINQEYLKLKQKIEEKNEEINKLEATKVEEEKQIEDYNKQLDILNDDETIYKAKAIELRRRKEKENIEDAEKEEIEKAEAKNNENLKKVQDRKAEVENTKESHKANIERIKKQVENFQIKIAETEVKIDAILLELKQDPQLNDYLNRAMNGKYKKRKSEINEEKDELVSQKEEVDAKINRMNNLKTLVAEHPQISNRIKAMINAKIQIETAKKEIEDLKNKYNQYEDKSSTLAISLADQIAGAQEKFETIIEPEAIEKMSTNKEVVMSYIVKNEIDIKEEDIEGLANGDIFRNNGKGNVNLEETIVRQTSPLKKQSHRIQKKIESKDLALSYVDKAAQITNREIEEFKIPEPELEPNSKPELKPEPNPISSITQEPYEIRGNQFTPVEEKPKWYQFIKRFKNWRETRKQKALPDGRDKEPDQDQSPISKPEGDPISKPEPDPIFELDIEENPISKPQPQPSKPKDNPYKNSLKYEVVQQLRNEKSEENIIKAAEQAKQERKDQQER